MEKFFLSLILFLGYSIECLKALSNDFKNSQESVMIRAVAKGIKSLHMHNTGVNIFGNSELADANFLNLALRQAYQDSTVTVTVVSKSFEGRSSRQFSFCNVIILDKPTILDDLSKVMSPKKFDFRGYFLLVVMDKIEEKVLLELSTTLSKARIINFVMIHGNKESVFVSTFKPFAESSCVGRFSTTPGDSEQEETFKAQSINMRNCSVKVSTFILKPFVMSQNAELVGRDIEIIKALSQALRFKLEIDLIVGDLPWGMVYDNGTATGAMEKLLHNDTDIILGDYFLNLDRLKFFDHTSSYFESQFAYLVPPPEKLSSFAKLFQPFDLDVWMTLLVCFIAGALIIVLLSYTSKQVRANILGSGTTTPLTNMLIVILGSSQAIVPSNSCARLLLMAFIIFCMIVRTVFQGSLFKFLQSDGNRRQISSVDEMLKENFNFHIGKSYENMIDKTSSMYSRWRSSLTIIFALI